MPKLAHLCAKMNTNNGNLATETITNENLNTKFLAPEQTGSTKAIYRKGKVVFVPTDSSGLNWITKESYLQRKKEQLEKLLSDVPSSDLRSYLLDREAKYRMLKQENEFLKGTVDDFKFRMDAMRPRLRNIPAYSSSMTSTINPPPITPVYIANPHLDKDLLTRDDLLEVLMWAYQRPDDGTLSEAANQYTLGKPDSAIARYIAAAGELLYGANNYIGPNKVGNLDAPLVDIVTTVPALSEADARARAHDIGLSVSQSPHVDDILPTFAKHAQLFRAPAQGMTNFAKIKLSGDVEENPGPTPDGIPAKGFAGDEDLWYCEKRKSQIRNFIDKSCLWNWPILKDILYRQAVDEDIKELWNNSDAVIERLKCTRHFFFDSMLTHPEVQKRLTDKFCHPEARRAYRFATHTGNLHFWVPVMMFALKREDEVQYALMFDVEPNPGPPSANEEAVVDANANKSVIVNKVPNTQIGPDSSQDIITALVSNPTLATSYLNYTPGSEMVNQQSYWMRHGTKYLRGTFNDYTDNLALDANWVQLAGYDYSSIDADAEFPEGCRLHRYTLYNRDIRGSIPVGALGQGLDASLKTFSDFLAVNRTSSNAVAGDKLLEINVRTNAVDYGYYMNPAKILAYSWLDRTLSCCPSDTFLGDVMSRMIDIDANPVDVLYPSSINLIPANVDIEATWITQTEYAQILTGSLAAAWSLDDPDVAWIPMTNSYTRESLALIALSYLEFPFFTIDTTVNGELLTFNGTANPPNTSAIFCKPRMLEEVRIDGPKHKICFIMTDNSAEDFNIGTAANSTIVLSLTAGGPFPNCRASLVSYVNSEILTGTMLGMVEAMDYHLKFMSLEDWKACIITAATITSAKMPYHGQQFVVGGQINSPPLFCATASFASNMPFVQVTTKQNFDDIFDLVTEQPQYDTFGGRSYKSIRVPDGGVSRAVVAPTAYYQDCTTIVKYAILIGLLKKNVMSGAKANEVYKNVRIPLFFMAGQVQDILMDHVAFWFLENRVTNMIHFNGQVVIDQRNALFKDLADRVCKWQTKATGISFLRPANWVVPVTPAELTIPGFSNAAQWYDTPIILTKAYFYTDYFKFELGHKYTLGDIEVKWQACSNGGLQVFGTAIGGVSSIRVKEDAAFQGNKHMNIGPATMYALSRVQSSMNPNPWIQLVNFYLSYAGSNIIKNMSSPYIFSKDFLRWASNDAPADQFIFSTYNLGPAIFPPFYPPNVDFVTGQKLLPSCGVAGIVKNQRDGFTLDGTGSANLDVTDSIVAPGSDELAGGANFNF